jgi:hypothetical protein
MVLGPYYVDYSLYNDCQLEKETGSVPVTIVAPEWALLALALITAAVLIHLLSPCCKCRMSNSLSLTRSASRNALFDQEMN